MKTTVRFVGGPLDGTVTFDFHPAMNPNQSGFPQGSVEFMAWLAYSTAMMNGGQVGGIVTGMNPASFVRRYVEGDQESRCQASNYMLAERYEKDGEVFATFRCVSPPMSKQQLMESIRKELGRHVVVVYRKGGRIKEERIYDSETDSLGELRGVQHSLRLLLHDTPLGIELIGKGWVGLLPWESLPTDRKPTAAEILNAHCPVRVADVVENSQTGITTIYLESV